MDEDYLRDCHDENCRLLNNGGLFLVSRKYFPFGEALVRVVNSAMTQESIVEDGDSFMDLARKRIKKEENRLKKLFFECSVSFDELEEQQKNKMFEELVTKTSNAKFDEEINTYKERNTRRHGKHHEGQAFRQDMKSKAKKTLVKNKTVEEAKKAKPS